MPGGYWSGLWSATWQTAVFSGILITIFYWARVPVNGHSILMPLAAPFYLGLMALFAAIPSVFGSVLVRLFAPSVAPWVGAGIFLVAYGLIVMSRGGDTQFIDQALGSFRFILVVVAAGFLWLRVVSQLGGRFD